MKTKKGISKRTCIIFQAVLLVWFLLDMTGFSIGDICLVERSFKDDGVFFIIYLATFIWFIIQNSIGKWDVLIWSGMWYVTQFLGHEWYTIFGSGIMGSVDGKIQNYVSTVKLFSIEGRYVPDLYHIVEHLLILSVFITTLLYIINKRRKFLS